MPEQTDLVDLETLNARLDAPIRFDIRYASANNILGRPIYSRAAAFLQRPAAEALGRAHAELLQQGYGLLVFDAYRPLSVTRELWEGISPEARKFFADPAQGSVHNRGCAVDLTLYHLDSGAIAEMDGEFDEVSGRSYHDYAGASPEARARRLLLKGAMEAQGFAALAHEWWHYSLKGWRDFPLLDVGFEELARK